MPCKCKYYEKTADKKGKCNAGDYSGNRCPILHGYKLAVGELKLAVGKFQSIQDLTVDDFVYCSILDILEKSFPELKED